MSESITFGFDCEGVRDGAFEVVRFSGEEGMSEAYRFEVDLLTETDDIDVDDLQDRDSTLTITGAQHERKVHGILAQVEVLDYANGYYLYRVSLVPRIWQLKLSRANAVYLDRTTPEIIRTTLEQQVGITSADFDQKLESDYRSWPFRLQYGEDYWSFLSRLMERDGIYYYFTEGDEGERIVFADSAGQQPSIDGPRISHTAALGMAASGDTVVDGSVDSLIMRQARVPETVWVQNYNDDRPSTPIRESATIDERGVGDVNLYGQNVLDPQEARAIVDVRAEEYRWPKITYHGESTAFRFTAGHRFELSGAPRERNNIEYQLLRVEHTGYNPVTAGKAGLTPDHDGPVYENRFTAIPADTQYRSARVTDWPRIHGTINAIIDAEGDGRFAELDNEGRYHVVFPFHRGFADPGREDPGKASHWVRMVQPYSGSREGMHFPLRKGARVLIGFIGGNPDLPVISGAVPTAEQPSVTNEGNQAKSNIKTKQNLIEIDDERPRIKFQTRKSRSYFHLGSSNDPGDGITTSTDGLNRINSLGGRQYTFLTYGWPDGVDSDAVNADLVAELPNARLQQFNQTLSQAYGEGNGDSADFDDDADWDVFSNAGSAGLNWPQDIYKFKIKHDADNINADLDEDDTATTSEDGRHDLFIERTVGVAYRYRLGMDFQFHGDHSEVFNFGRLSEFTTAKHDVNPAELRDHLTNAIPRFEDDAGDFERHDNVFSEWVEKREDRKKKRDKIRKDAKNYGDSVRREYSTFTNTIPESHLVFDRSDDDDLDEWLTLRNETRNPGGITETTGTKYVSRGYSSVERVTKTFLSVDPNSAGSAGDPDSPLTGSIAEAEKKLEDEYEEYEKTKERVWEPYINESRTSVNKYDLYKWHDGNIYDFGGNWDYNLGNGYEENHILQTSELNSDNLEHDLLNKGGPEWDGIDIADQLKDVAELPGLRDFQKAEPDDLPERWTQDSMWVEKTIGDQYSYHNGAEIEVHVGPSEEVRKGGPNISTTYIGRQGGGSDIEMERVVSAGGVTETWRRHKYLDFPMHWSKVQWGGADAAGFGEHKIAMNYAPSASVELNGSTSASTAVNVGATTSAKVNLGVAADFSVDVSAKASLALSLAATVDVKFHAAFKVEVDNKEVTVKAAGTKLYTNASPTELEMKVNTLQKNVASLSSGTMALSNKVVSLENGQISVDGKAVKIQ